MKRYIIISIVLSVALISSTLAQTVYDAMLFSRHYAGGTARSMGMSGAYGALGGDVSVLSTNPAGLAVYRGSEFVFTPALNFVDTKAKFDNNTFSDKNTRFILNNIGYVFTKNMYNEKGLQSVNFGFAYNRLSDFNSKTYVKTPSAKSSLLDEFEINANSDAWRPGFEYIAWDTYAIDHVINDKYDETFSAYNFFDNEGEAFFRYDQPLFRSISSSGSIGEYAISLGLNFNHNLYFGATFGIQNHYFYETVYHEESPSGGDLKIDYFNFRENYSLSGLGINFKAGVIYRPVSMLRLGAAVHTPTQSWLQASHETTMTTEWNTPPADENTMDEYRELAKINDNFYIAETFNDLKFSITTPWRYSISAATILGQFGLVSVDVEIIDYSTMKMGTVLEDFDMINHFKAENALIKEYYRPALNLKTGAEARLGILHIRAGMAYYGSPYNKDKFETKPTFSYSGGIGFRKRDFYMDAAYSFTKKPNIDNDMYLTYDDLDATLSLQSKSNKVLVTFGFRF